MSCCPSLTVGAPAPATRETAERFTSSSTAPRVVTETDWTRIGTAVLDPQQEGEPFDTAAPLSLGAVFFRTDGSGACEIRLVGYASEAQTLALANESGAPTWEVASGASAESAFAVEARVTAGTTGRLELWTVSRRP